MRAWSYYTLVINPHILTIIFVYYNPTVGVLFILRIKIKNPKQKSCSYYLFLQILTCQKTLCANWFFNQKLWSGDETINPPPKFGPILDTRLDQITFLNQYFHYTLLDSKPHIFGMNTKFLITVINIILR